MGINKKNFLRHFAFTLILFIIFIVAFEIILRETHILGAAISWSQPDPKLGWRYTAEQPYWYNKENDHPITGTINKYGWRDRNWSLKKAPNTYRIAILGDSFVAAFQVESNKTFVKLAENIIRNKLHNRSLDVEMMNFGRSGATQNEELIILQNYILQFSPDMVVLFFFPGNDIKEISPLTDHSPRPFYHISDDGRLVLDTSFTKLKSYKIKTLINPLKQHSALISFITARYNAFLQQRRLNLNKGESNINAKKLDSYLTLSTDHPDSKYVENYKLAKLLINEMATICYARGIKFMLVSMDNPAYIREKEKEFLEIDRSFNSNFFEDDLNDFASNLGIEYLGLQRIFRADFENNHNTLHWGHWNYEGHRVVANALANKVIEILNSSDPEVN